MIVQIASFKQKILQKQRQETQIINQNDQESNSLGRPIQRSPKQKVFIIIDTRKMKDHGERLYFQESLIENYRIDVITYSLTIGDFVFAYNGQILDYIIERKKVDDLSTSILDGRYKQQKYRLKNSGAQNIFYLYEGFPSQRAVLKQKHLMGALVKTRLTDGFKVVRTANAIDTVKFLSQIHKQIQEKIDTENQQVFTIGTLEQYNLRNTKNKYLTIENIFGFGLKSFPSAGKQAVHNILRYFKSFYLLFKQLEKYQTNIERIEFLNGLLKGGRTQATVITLIVQFLFNKDYGGNIDNGTLQKYLLPIKQG